MALSKSTIKGLRPVGSADFGPASGLGPDWLLCDGSQYPQSQYPALYAVLGTRYNTGGETAGYFRVPNPVDRALVGPDDYGTAMGAASRNTNSGHSTLSASGIGGAATIAITRDQFPNHQHATNEPATHSHGVSAGGHTHPGRSRTSTAWPIRHRTGSTTMYPCDGYTSSMEYSSIIADFPSAGSGYSMGSVGSGAAHANEQPFLTMRLFIKAM